jgi:hypothetical protein
MRNDRRFFTVGGPPGEGHDNLSDKLRQTAFSTIDPVDVLSVGVPVLTDPSRGWNFWPFVGIPVALFVAFRCLRLQRRASIAAVATMAGLASADAVSAWGVMPVLVAGACLVVVAAIALRGWRRTDPPKV